MKFTHKCCALVSAVSICCTSMTNVFAIETDTIDELWGKPTVVYGGGLSDEQINETASLFGITDSNNVYTLVVDANDLATYLNFQGGSTSSLISSVLVQKTGSNGVVVNILTPENITSITSDQYANAAITAGVTNCEIEVASISKVTGESALTGVYKAFEANGETIDPERSAVAQEELEVTNEIAQENASDENFSSEALSQAIIDIKEQMAELKENNGGSISYEEIAQIVQQVLNDYGLGNLLTEENINALIEFANKYANTSAIDSQEVLEQLQSLSGTLSSKFGDLINTAQQQGWFDKIVNWVKGLFGL